MTISVCHPLKSCSSFTSDDLNKIRQERRMRRAEYEAKRPRGSKTAVVTNRNNDITNDNVTIEPTKSDDVMDTLPEPRAFVDGASDLHSAPDGEENGIEKL